MSDCTIFHNPRCSKSRATLALLEEHGVSPRIRLYLQDPPDVAELKAIVKKLGISAAQLVRRGEPEYRESGLGPDSSEGDILAAMAAHPKLIERPIVVRGRQAVLGRPPENVLALID